MNHIGYRYSNGDKYIGNFAESKMEGNGKFIWCCGSYYDGEFTDNHITGFGYKYQVCSLI